MDVLGAPSNPATFDAVCGEARGLENVTLIKKPGKQGNTDWDTTPEALMQLIVIGLSKPPMTSPT